ncbi:MAG: hypothetical protein RLZZ591_1263 [Pseudomonadota bacterium]|jgi:type I restriction enzyme S subunit
MSGEQVKQGYKRTEVGVIPEEWAVRPFGELTATVASGRSKVGIAFGNYPVHGSTGVIGFCEKTEYEGDAILIARVGANAGKLNTATGKYGVTDNTIIVRVRSDSSLSFFYRQLENKRLNSLVFGSGQPLITGSQLKALAVCEPPLPEQHAIATALSDVNALLNKLDQLIAKKRDLKQATMQQLLTGQTRLPGFSGEWEVKRLGEIAEIVMGQSPSSINYNRSGAGLPLIQGNADILNRQTIKRIFTTEITKRGKSGDVLMSVRAPVGEISRATFDVCLGRGVCAIRYPNDFLCHLLISLEPTWMRLSKGSTFDSVNSSDVRALEVNMPKESVEQTAIATVLSDMDAELTALEARRDKSHALKQGMMQELLTGRIRLI